MYKSKKYKKYKEFDMDKYKFAFEALKNDNQVFFLNTDNEWYISYLKGISIGSSTPFKDEHNAWRAKIKPISDFRHYSHDRGYVLKSADKFIMAEQQSIDHIASTHKLSYIDPFPSYTFAEETRYPLMFIDNQVEMLLQRHPDYEGFTAKAVWQDILFDINTKVNAGVYKIKLIYDAMIADPRAYIIKHDLLDTALKVVNAYIKTIDGSELDLRGIE